MADLDQFTILETPKGKISHLLMAFRGWPDANEAATWAIKCLLKKLPSRKMAEMDPEEFFDFSQVRPLIRLNSQGVRYLQWPSNELFYHSSSNSSRSFMVFLGTEPSLKWRTYCDSVLDQAMKSGVRTVVHVGALLDAVPHTRPLRITGSVYGPKHRKSLTKLGIRSSNYQGPSGISSAMMERCSAKGLEFVTLWGHTSHYLQTAPNYQVAHGIVTAVCQLLNLKLDWRELKASSSSFEEAMQIAVEKDSQLKAYVEKLEEHYDTETAALTEIPNAEDMVRELEKFLKDQRSSGNNS